jgi:hypothetical protein
MKKILKFTTLSAVLLALAGGVASCKENDVPVYPITMIGEWKWVKTYTMTPLGDMNPLTPENTGITESIILKADSSWSKIKNQEVVEFGEKFTIGTGIYFLDGSSQYIYDSILYIKNGVPVETDYFKIENDNLIFSFGFAGATGSATKWFKKHK